MDQYGAAVASDGRDYLVAYLEADRLVTKKFWAKAVSPPPPHRMKGQSSTPASQRPSR
jgi:hypothetical protein